MCTSSDQIAFNTNLIKVFYTEYNRYNIQSQTQHQQNSNPSSLLISSQSSSLSSTVLDDKVLEWKFTMLDINTNQMLDKNEYRELKRLVRKVRLVIII